MSMSDSGSEERDNLKVTLRLSSPYAGRVRVDSKQNGMSEGQFVRSLVFRHYEKQELLDLRDEVREMRKELSRFRADFDDVVGQ